ncbi:MAG: hypothetical protein WCF19_02390 [Chlamydiales bacterium]
MKEINKALENGPQSKLFLKTFKNQDFQDELNRRIDGLFKIEFLGTNIPPITVQNKNQCNAALNSFSSDTATQSIVKYFTTQAGSALSLNSAFEYAQNEYQQDGGPLLHTEDLQVSIKNQAPELQITHSCPGTILSTTQAHTILETIQVTAQCTFTLTQSWWPWSNSYYQLKSPTIDIESREPPILESFSV